MKRRTPEVQTVRPWTPAELAAATVHSPSSLTAMSTVICPEEVHEEADNYSKGLVQMQRDFLKFLQEFFNLGNSFANKVIGGKVCDEVYW